MNLQNIDTEVLKRELERRAQLHRFTIQGVDFELTLEQIKELQAELNKINPPTSIIPNNWEEWVKRESTIQPPSIFPDDPLEPPFGPWPAFKRLSTCGI